MGEEEVEKNGRKDRTQILCVAVNLLNRSAAIIHLHSNITISLTKHEKTECPLKDFLLKRITKITMQDKPLHMFVEESNFLHRFLNR